MLYFIFIFFLYHSLPPDTATAENFLLIGFNICIFLCRCQCFYTSYIGSYQDALGSLKTYLLQTHSIPNKPFSKIWESPFLSLLSLISPFIWTMSWYLDLCMSLLPDRPGTRFWKKGGVLWMPPSCLLSGWSWTWSRTTWLGWALLIGRALPSPGRSVFSRRHTDPDVDLPQRYFHSCYDNIMALTGRNSTWFRVTSQVIMKMILWNPFGNFFFLLSNISIVECKS